MFADITSQILALTASASPGVLVHGANTYTVTRSYGPAEEEAFVEFGTQETVADCSVVIPVADLQTPHPATEDSVTLDGEALVVGNRITKTPHYWLVPLRKRQ